MSVRSSLLKYIEKSRGFYLSNQFDVALGVPAAIANAVDTELVNLAAMSVTIGSLSITPVNNNFSLLPMPSDISDQQMTIAFRLSNVMAERKLFEAWRLAVFPESRNIVAYLDDIVADAEINIKTRNDRLLATIEVKDAYPTTISPLDLSFDNSNIATMTVSFLVRGYEFKEQM